MSAMSSSRSWRRSLATSASSVRNCTWVASWSILRLSSATSSVVVLISTPLPCHRHVGRDRHFLALEQHVPVHPAEHHLAPVVHLGLLQQRKRTDTRKWVLARKRLRVVVEVNQQAFAKTRFDEAVGVPVEFLEHGQTVDVP